MSLIFPEMNILFILSILIVCGLLYVFLRLFKMKQKLEKWEKWFKTVYQEVTNLAVKRHVFWEVQDVIKNNPKIQKPSAFYEFIGDSYAASMVMEIRRLVKRHKDSISFAGLLEDIRDNPQIMSRGRYVAFYKESNVEHRADGDFDQFAERPGGDHIDPTLVEQDLQELVEKAQKCEAYADRRVAHYDKGPITVPTFNDLDDCVDFLERLTKKYYLLMTGSALTEVLPTFQYDWQQVFTEPWLPIGKENYCYYKTFLAGSSLPENHYAYGMPDDAPIIPALDYFLSLNGKKNFDKKMNKFLTESINRGTTNQGEVQFHSICAEFRAMYLVGEILGLSITGFDEISPKAKGQSDCDIVAEFRGERLCFEVKAKCKEASQSLPDALVAALNMVESVYTLTPKLRSRSYNCEDMETLLEKIKKHIANFESQKESDYSTGDDLPIPYVDEDIYIQFAIKEDDEPTCTATLFDCDAMDDVCSYLLEEGKPGKVGKPMTPMIQQAQDKGADYLVCRVRPWDELDKVVNHCFENVDQQTNRTYSCGDERLGIIRGIILFSDYDNYVIINNLNAGTKQWIKK